MAIYMIRHGKTLANVKRCFADENEPILPIDEETKRGVIEKVKRLPIKRLAASPYKRTRETAAFLSEALEIAVDIEPLIHEMRFGVMEGHSFEEASKLYGDALQAFLDDPYHIAPPEGESLKDVYERAKKFLERAREDTLYVSHEGFIRMVGAAMRGDKMPAEDERIDNLEIVEFS